MNKKEFHIEIIVEIPKGSRNKYEYDYNRDSIVFDRMLFSSVHYPADYGFVPKTLALDGDSLDALVLLNEPTYPGCIINTRPIGIFMMEDDKGQDDKILCVPITDPLWNHVYVLSQVPPHLLNEIEHFFSIYKDLEQKKVKINGWGGKEKAIEIIELAQHEFEKRKSNSRNYSSSSVLSNKIVCAECGSFYGAKVWHSNSKYKRTIWQCNNKYKGKKCKTPHVYEEDIKNTFVEEFNKMIENKDEIITDCEEVLKQLLDTSEIEQEIQALKQEKEVVE